MSKLSALAALEGGPPDPEDGVSKAARLAARQARFGQQLQGNRFKELEASRIAQRKAFEDQGLISSGKTELDDAIDMRGTCEAMCSEYEREAREFKHEVNIFEASAADRRRMDPEKAVAAYTRSDAGAGHGAAAVLPSDLRTPATLVRTLDYLFARIMPTAPPPPSAGPAPAYNERKALGYSAGFIRDRTRAIRKEFAMQSSWGHKEGIATFERIARWHILCLRELQEESGMNADMHIDSAELGRCFTSLRQQYNDRREETGLELPCANEPEFRAYMLIFDLTSKSVGILTSELPAVILDHPLVRLAWQIRVAAQRNFDSQKEGSKNNAELGMNLVTRFVRLLKQAKVPYLLSCLVEIRLREMRRSALRALTRTYPRLRSDPIRLNDAGEVIERRMVLVKILDRILGCEPLETVESAWDDVVPVPRDSAAESVNVVEKFNLEVYFDESNGQPMGSLINLGSAFNDNEDAPFTRRWKYITDKRGSATYQQIVNGKAGIHINGAAAPLPAAATRTPAAPIRPAAVTLNPQASPFSFAPKGPVAPETAYAPPPSFSFAPIVKDAQPKPPAMPPPLAISISAEPSAPKPLFSFGLDKPASPPVTEPVKPVQPAPLFALPTATPAPTTPSIIKPPTPASSNFGLSPQAGPSKSPAPPASIRQLSPVQPSPITTPVLAPPSPLRASVRRPHLTDADRARRQHALPFVRNMLIKEVVDEIISGMAPDLLAMVKQEAAAKAYVQAKAKRQEMIEDWSAQILESILREDIAQLSMEALADEIHERNLVRRVVLHWRDWAHQSRLDRETRERDRQETLSRLSRMGLGGASLGTAQDGPRSGGSMPEEMPRVLDELETDVVFHDMERSKDSFYRPSTFFTAVARHVAPLLATVSTASTQTTFHSRSRSPAPPHAQWYKFRTVLSSARDSASPPKVVGSDWLAEKLLPPHEEYELDGVEFETATVGRYDELPKTADIGLCVFEAPMKTLSTSSTEENIADAQDRLSAIADLVDKPNVMYEPALLLVSWDGETLEELVDRLDLSETVAFFSQVAVLSLEYMDSLDKRFSTALETILPTVKRKEQVVLDLHDFLTSLAPAWDRVVALADLISRQALLSGDTLLACFDAGIQAINDVGKVIKSAIGKARIDGESPLGTPFPSFTMPIDDVSLADAADAILAYFSDNQIEGSDDSRLLAAALHRVAHLRHAQPLPIASLLQALMSSVTGALDDQRIVLKVWLRDGSAVEQYRAKAAETATKRYEVSISSLIGRLSRTLPDPTSAVPRKTPASAAPKHLSTAHGLFTPVKQSSLTNLNGKRARGESDENLPPSDDGQLGGSVRETVKRESKSLKTRRLMKALESVRTTLASIRAREEGEEGDYEEDEDLDMAGDGMGGRGKRTLLFT